MAKVNKVQKVESPQVSHVSPPVSHVAPQVSQMSPRLWFKKKQQKKEDTATMPQGLSKSKSGGQTKSNQVRPVSLLASISDFDREAAKIVQQRQKDEEARKRVNDESFYIPADDVAAASVVVTNPDDNAQEALDEIMANVEQKMECLDAIGKHNQRWEKRMNHVEQRESIPSIDMNGLVSDLNQFLNTTKKELMTPKTRRKHQLQKQEQEQELLEEQRKQLDAVEKMENKQEEPKLVQVQQQQPKKQSPPVKPKPKQELQTPLQQKQQRQQQQQQQQRQKQQQQQSKIKNPSVPKEQPKPQRQLRTRNQVNPNQQQIHEYEDTWNCTKCTLINSTKTNICILCGASFLNTKSRPVDLQDLHQELEDKSIFDPIEPNESEEMPVKGNVLDRVVQFTAMQMAATERPTSAMTSWMEMSPRTSMADLEPRPMSAIGSQSSRPESEIFVPTPVVHRVQNKNNIGESQTPRRLSVLEKDETTEILAKWKQEHEEREKARRDFFESMAKEKSAPKDSVVETQAALLEQAKRKLEIQSNNKEVVVSQKIQGSDKTDSSTTTVHQSNIDETKNTQNNSKGNSSQTAMANVITSPKNVQTNRSAKGAIESLGHANQKRLKTANDPVNENSKSNSRQQSENGSNNNKRNKKSNNNNLGKLPTSSKSNNIIDHGNAESKNDGGGGQKSQGQNNSKISQQQKSPKAAAPLKNDSQGHAKNDNVIDTTINGQGDKTSTGQVAPKAGQGIIIQTPSRSKPVNNKANLAANNNDGAHSALNFEKSAEVAQLFALIKG